MNPLENKKRIILLEDDADLRIVYSTILINEGYEVRIAPDGDLGMDLIRSSDWNLVLLDVMLPKIDGIEILKKIAKEGLKKGKVVILTNLNNESVIEEVFRQGADGYITKSEVSPGSLVEEVKGYLNNPV